MQIFSAPSYAISKNRHMTPNIWQYHFFLDYCSMHSKNMVQKNDLLEIIIRHVSCSFDFGKTAKWLPNQTLGE